MIVPPALFGHELAGDIVAMGAGVRDFSVGQRVVAATPPLAANCFYCQRGQENLCEDSCSTTALRPIHPHSQAHCLKKHVEVLNI